MTEEWRGIPEWDGFYEVSNLGRVRSLDRLVPYGVWGRTRYRGRILKAGWGSGYALVTFVRKDKRQQYYVHDLVLLAFAGPKPEGQEVCHGPLGPGVNSLDNLRYDTRSANAQDRKTFGKPWAKRGVVPLLTTCAVCGTDIAVTRHKWRGPKNRLCRNPECLALWGSSTYRNHRAA